MPAPMIDTLGVTHDVADEHIDARLAQGWRQQTTADMLASANASANEAAYGGVGGAIKAGLAAGARGLTLGGSDVLARAIGGEDAAIELEGLRAENPGLSTGFEIGGGIAPVLFSGGAGALGAAARLTPAGLVGRAGASVGAAAGGGLRGALAAGAVEGGLSGVGGGATELALSNDPLTWERAASAIGSNALFGAGVGAAAGGTFNAVERGLSRATGAIDAALERRATAKARTPEEAIESGDLTLLNSRILDAAEKTEIDRLAKEQAPQRRALTDDLDEWRRANRDEHDLRAVAQSADDPNLREASAAFDRANIRLRGALDDRVGFAEDPAKSIKAVRTQGQALEDMRDAARAYERRWRQDLDEAPAKIRAGLEEVSALGPSPDGGAASLKARKKLAAELGLGDEIGPFTEAGIEAAAARVLKERQSYFWGGAVKGGLKEPSIVGRMSAIEGMLATNQKLQSRLAELAKAPASDLLNKIAEARAALSAPKGPDVGIRAMVSAAAPFAGPVGAAAAAGSQLIGRFGKFVEAATERTGKIASSFLGVAEKGAARVSPYAPVVATKVLASLRYGNEKREKEPSTLPELYRARTDEIKQLTAYDETGTPRVRPAVRERIGRALHPISVIDPVMADRIETQKVRGVEYLSSIIPRRPDIAGVPIGPDNWQPSDLAMRSWARSAAAVEDPYGVLERALHGAITPEDAAAMHNVHVEILNDFTNSVMSQLPELRQSLPYDRQLALSILTGKPVTPALDPQVLSVLQDQFPEEPGSAGGTQAPKAQPQFGSMQKSVSQPTPAQSRAQGAHV